MQHNMNSYENVWYYLSLSVHDLMARLFITSVWYEKACTC